MTKRRHQDNYPTSYTFGQMTVHNWLQELGITTDVEVPMGKYCIDLLARHEWIVFEYDGPMHNKKKDKIRDEYLMENFNLPTYRIKTLFPKEEVKVNLIQFASEWADSAQKRKNSCL